MNDEMRDLLEAEAEALAQRSIAQPPTPSTPEPERKPLKLVTCEACPETLYEKDAMKVNGMLLCKACAAKESSIAKQVAPVNYAPSPYFPGLNQPKHAQHDIPNNDLDPNTEEYREIFNEVKAQIALMPHADKLSLIRERIDKLDAFMRKAKTQRQVLTVGIDDLYTNATEAERAALLIEDQKYKAAHPKKAAAARKPTGEIRLTKAEEAYPAHWSKNARKAASVFINQCGMTLAATEVKLREMKLVQ